MASSTAKACRDADVGAGLGPAATDTNPSPHSQMLRFTAQYLLARGRGCAGRRC
jgi:hypothetical protein